MPQNELPNATLGSISPFGFQLSLGERIVQAARLAAAAHLAASSAQPVPTGAISINADGPMIRRQEAVDRPLAA